MVCDQCAFHLGGTDTMAGDIDHVIDATGNPEIAVFIPTTTISSEILTRIGFEIRFNKALMIAIHGSHLAGPGI